MKKTFAIVTFAAIAIGAAAFAAGTAEIDPQSRIPAGTKGGISIPTYSVLFSRANNRVLSVEVPVPADGMTTYIIPEGQELLVRQLIIANGRFNNAKAEKGGLSIELIGDAAQPGVTLYYPYSDYGSQQFDFNPPMVLKANDRVSFNFQSVGGTPGYLQAAFHGEKIQTGTGLSLN